VNAGHSLLYILYQAVKMAMLCMTILKLNVVALFQAICESHQSNFVPITLVRL